jgi:hypothetical protein
MVWLQALASGTQLCGQADPCLCVSYHATFVPLPSQLLGQVCSALYTFVAANRPATAGVAGLYLTMSTCYRDFAHGGIRLIDIRRDAGSSQGDSVTFSLQTPSAPPTPGPPTSWATMTSSASHNRGITDPATGRPLPSSSFRGSLGCRQSWRTQGLSTGPGAASSRAQDRLPQDSVLSFPSLCRRQPCMSLQSSAMEVSGDDSLMALFTTPTSMLPLDAFSPSHTHPRTRLSPHPQGLPQCWSFHGTPSAPEGGQPQQEMGILSR